MHFLNFPIFLWLVILVILLYKHFLNGGKILKFSSMCIAPIILENPYYNRGVSFDGKQLYIGGKFDFLHNTIDRYISVPCGKCSHCVSLRQNYYVQRMQMESLRSELFYFTLSYANRGIKYTDIGQYKLPYPEYSDIQNMFKRLRKRLPHKIRTFVVSEYGSKRGRPHFHGFIAVSKDDIKQFYRGSHLYCEKCLFRDVLKEWRRNISTSRKFPQYINLCDFIVKGKKHTYELHWVEPLPGHDNDTTIYVTKYLLKFDKRIERLLYKIKKDPSLTDDETKELISKIKPRAVMSKDFGDYKLPDVQRHLKCSLSINSSTPNFVDINTGKTTLMSPYYRKHFVDIEYYFNRYWKWMHDVQHKDIVGLDGTSYNPEYLDENTVHDLNCKSSRVQMQDRHLKKVKKFVEKRST